MILSLIMLVVGLLLVFRRRQAGSGLSFTYKYKLFWGKIWHLIIHDDECHDEDSDYHEDKDNYNDDDEDDNKDY